MVSYATVLLDKSTNTKLFEFGLGVVSGFFIWSIVARFNESQDIIKESRAQKQGGYHQAVVKGPIATIGATAASVTGVDPLAKIQHDDITPLFNDFQDAFSLLDIDINQLNDEARPALDPNYKTKMQLISGAIKTKNYEQAIQIYNTLGPETKYVINLFLELGQLHKFGGSVTLDNHQQLINSARKETPFRNFIAAGDDSQQQKQLEIRKRNGKITAAAIPKVIPGHSIHLLLPTISFSLIVVVTDR